MNAIATAALPATSTPAPLWTPEHVARRLVEAFRTLDRMPKVAGPRRPGNHWPPHVVELADTLAMAELPEAERRERDARRNAAGLRPLPGDIARMDEALEWLRNLRGTDVDLAAAVTLWGLRAARRRSVRSLCAERGWLPQTFYRNRAAALTAIAATLNACGLSVA